ncbi:MAG: oligosaccharide flippase family protein [Spirochaetes bacterium]|nr:oligosaccharide flippase family protein [Spirochaetota bacterium]
MNIVKKIFSNSLFKTSSIYTITSIINSAIPFFLMPILTRYLSPEEYGITSMFLMLVSIISVFTGLSVHGAITRVYFEKKINFKEYVANCVFILFISSFITFIIVLLFLDFIYKYSGVPKIWILVAVIFSFLQFLILSNLSIYQVQKKAKYYGLIQIGQSFLNVIFSVILVVLLKMKWEGRIIAIFLATLFFGLISVFNLLKNFIEWRINIEYIKDALNFGLPLIPHTLGGILDIVSTRFIITNLLGLEKTGIYTTAVQISMIINLFIESFKNAYNPWLFEKLSLNNESIKFKIVLFTYIYFILVIIFSIIFGFFAPLFIKYLLGKKFQLSSSIVFWLCIGNAFNGMYYMVAIYIPYVNKNYFLAIVTFLTGLLNIPINILLIRKYGLIGASFSYLIIMIIKFLFTWMLSSNIYKMPWLLKIKGGLDA